VLLNMLLLTMFGAVATEAGMTVAGTVAMAMTVRAVTAGTMGTVTAALRPTLLCVVMQRASSLPSS
jgi:hypothetical protein